jgi:UDP-3-O-[3-hydroxymyristoyl] glucosamine N-acyltransferase
MAIALGELAVRFGCELRGDPQLQIAQVAPLATAGAGAVSFLANSKLVAALAATRASAVVLEPRVAAACPVAALISVNPHALFARIASLLYPLPPLRPGIHPSALVDASAQIDASAEVAAYAVIGAGAVVGSRCYIGPACLIGENARLGPDCRLVARVTLQGPAQLGARALIHPGVVIGADGFGLAREGQSWLKVPQIGSVRIGDDVEIGANTTIDRGAIEDTVIHDGVKLDNQIQVGHNVQIGAHTAIAACTGIAGSTRIGARCIIGGGTGIAGHLEICDDVILSAMAAVAGSIRKPGVYSSVIPVEPVRRWRRIVARLKLLERRSPQDLGAARAFERPSDRDEQQQRDEQPQDQHDE